MTKSLGDWMATGSYYVVELDSGYALVVGTEDDSDTVHFALIPEDALEPDAVLTPLDEVEFRGTLTCDGEVEFVASVMTGSVEDLHRKLDAMYHVPNLLRPFFDGQDTYEEYDVL